MYPYRTYQDASSVPEEITQIGIAAGVEINYSHVPRAVKRLMSQGKVLEVTTHIAPHPTSRRRKAYFLTEEGMNAAVELLSLLGDFKVIFKDKQGKTYTRSLAEINKTLRLNEELFTLYKFLNSDNIFDAKSWEESKKKAQDITQDITSKFTWHDYKEKASDKAQMGGQMRDQMRDQVMGKVRGKVRGKVKKIEITKMELSDVKEVLGSDFEVAEIEAIYHHTDGDPKIIQTILEIDKLKLEELTDLSAEERALTLCIMARAKLEKSTHKE